MRHQHAGLAIPDFPLAYGLRWPPTDDAFLSRINAVRTDTRDFNPITAFQIHAHMAHPCWRRGSPWPSAWLPAKTRRLAGTRSLPGCLVGAWILAVGAQIGLGAFTVWSNKAADVATAHVVVGAICLGLGALTTAASRVGWVRETQRVPTDFQSEGTLPKSGLISAKNAALVGSNG